MTDKINTCYLGRQKTYEALRIPREAPVQRSVASADIKPASARLNMRLLGFNCIFITTAK